LRESILKMIFGSRTRYISCLCGFMIKNGIVDPYEALKDRLIKK
jgi:hypothetical protein